ncbi:MAG: efflux RND transporter periplasmic adaptor subunit [Planctomycetota bacterium]|jgi:multidrug efflux pump subunit AcrA (membrane-fusion protein)
MSEVDLSALRLEPSGRERAPKRPLGPRLALYALVMILLGVIASFLVPLLAPVRVVKTAPVRAAGVAAATGTSVAEAAGWVEPDPFPVVVRPLVSGVLEALPLLEGDAVKKGETVVGRLVSAERLAKRDAAAANLKRREAELAAAQVALKWARELLDQKADVRTAETNARHHIDITQNKADSARAALVAARADRDRWAADLEGQEKLADAGGTYPVALAKARAALAAAQARVTQREEELDTLETELLRDKELHAIAKEVLDDPRTLKAAVERADARFRAVAAERDAARVEVETAARELDWCTVKAPMDGVVMTLLAAPGAHVGPGGEGIVSLYDPKKLQARIDVPLASVGRVAAGQEVAVRTEVVGTPTKGVVIRVQRESDMLKNTLQVKVRLIDPDPILRPETLCRASFLASGKEAKAGPALFVVPAAAVRNGSVFVVGDGRARRVAVEKVGDRGSDVVVKGDLSPTQQVILDAVEEGERVE